MPHPAGLARALQISLRTFQTWVKGTRRAELRETSDALHTRVLADITDWGVANPASKTMAIFVSKSQLGQYDMPEKTQLEVTGRDGKDLSIVLIPMMKRSVEDWEQMAHEGKETEEILAPSNDQKNLLPILAVDEETDGL